MAATDQPLPEARIRPRDLSVAFEPDGRVALRRGLEVEIAWTLAGASGRTLHRVR